MSASIPVPGPPGPAGGAGPAGAQGPAGPTGGSMIPPLPVGAYFRGGGHTNAGGALTLGRLYLQDFRMPAAGYSFDRAAFNLTAASGGGDLAIGIYELDEGMPGLLLDSHLVADMETTGVREEVIDFAALPDYFCLAALPLVTGCSMVTLATTSPADGHAVKPVATAAASILATSTSIDVYRYITGQASLPATLEGQALLFGAAAVPAPAIYLRRSA